MESHELADVGFCEFLWLIGILPNRLGNMLWYWWGVIENDVNPPHDGETCHEPIGQEDVERVPWMKHQTWNQVDDPEPCEIEGDSVFAEIFCDRHA